MALNETPIIDAPLAASAGCGVAMVSYGITSASESSTTLPVKASVATTLAIGQTVTISDIAWSTAATTYFITGVITGVSTVTHANDTITLTTASGLGTATIGAQAAITVGTGSAQVGNIYGTLYPYPYGTYKTGDTTPGGFGWSADIRGTTPNTVIIYDLATAPCTSANGGTSTTGGMAVCDFFLGDLETDSSSRYLDLIKFFATGGSNVIGSIRIDGNRNVGLYSNGGTPQTNLLQLPNNGWIRFYLATVWVSNTSNQTSVAVYYQLPGQSSVTQIGTTLNCTGLGANAASLLYFGQNQSVSQIYFGKFRMGRPRLYQIATLSDVAVPTGGYQDGVSPLYATSGIVGYVSSNLGGTYPALATNDGATIYTAITPAEAATRMKYTGYLPVDPIANSTSGCGTLLNIDTSTAPIVTAGTSYTFQTCGMNIQPISGQQFITFQNTKLLAPGGFTSDTGTTYKTSATTSVYDFVWQNNIPLTPLQSKAAVEAAVGSFYSTGSVLYINPLNGDVPTAGTSTYQRSYYINGSGAGSGDAAVVVATDLIQMSGIQSDGTALNDTGLTQSSYCLQDGSYGPGLLSPTTAGPVSAYSTMLRTIIKNGQFGKILGGHKHSIGQTFAYNNGSWLVQNCDIGPGLPGSTPMVNFSSNITGQNTGFSATWSQIRCPYPAMVFGSATGSASDANNSYTMHGGAGTNFSTLTFSAVSTTGSINVQGAIQNIVMNNGCNTGYCFLNAAVANTVSDCTITGTSSVPIQSGNQSPAATTTITDTIIIDKYNYGLTPGTIYGDYIYEGVTFDFSGTLGLSGNYMLSAASATGITVRGCVVIGPGGTNPPLNIFKSIPASGCPVVWVDIEYSGIQAGSYIVTSYAGGSTGVTLTAWQGLGFDSRSSIQGITPGFTLALSALNSPPYARTASATSKWNRGADSDRYTGVASDQYGNQNTVIIYPNRISAGATEFPSSSSGIGGNTTIKGNYGVFPTGGTFVGNYGNFNQ